MQIAVAQATKLRCPNVGTIGLLQCTELSVLLLPRAKMQLNVPVKSKITHSCPPPIRANFWGGGHLTFSKNVGQIPRYVASLDGQMPHPLELQRGSNPPPSRKNRIAYLLEIRGGGGTPRKIGCGCAAPLPKPLPFL